jgi:hypothetical protein
VGADLGERTQSGEQAAKSGALRSVRLGEQFFELIEHQQVELCWWRVCGQEAAQLITVVGGSGSREAVRQAELEQRLMHCRVG